MQGECVEHRSNCKDIKRVKESEQKPDEFNNLKFSCDNAVKSNPERITHYIVINMWRSYDAFFKWDDLCNEENIMRNKYYVINYAHFI